MYYSQPRGSLLADLNKEFHRFPFTYGTVVLLFIVLILEYIFPSITYSLSITPKYLEINPLWLTVTLLTHIIIHFGFLHFLFNAIALIFIGRYVEVLLGPRKTAIAFLISGIFGGVLTVLMAYLLPLINPLASYMVASYFAGASGAIFGLFAVLASDQPNTEFIFFIFPPIIPLIIPIRARGKTLLTLLMLSELIFGLIALPMDIYGHFAHLGGMIAGVLMYRYYLWKIIYQKIYRVEFY